MFNFEDVWNDPHSLYSVKCEDWSYEKEWRLVDFTKNCDSCIQLDNGKDIHLFNIPKSAIKNVTFGLNTPESIKSNVLNNISKLNCNDIKTFQLVTNNSTYDLEAKLFS